MSTLVHSLNQDSEIKNGNVLSKGKIGRNAVKLDSKHNNIFKSKHLATGR